MKYIDVVLPLPLHGTFTYAVPPVWDESLRIGMRVIVQFGNRKMYTGIIVLIHTNPPEKFKAREITGLLDNEPVIRRPVYKFWEWISSYYMCSVGEVYQAALPAGLKPESETEVCINPDFQADEILGKAEQMVLDFLSEGKPVAVALISKQTEIRYIMPVIKHLLELGAIEINENFTEKFKPKVTRYIRLSASYQSEEKLKELFDQLSRAKKQLELLMHYFELSGLLQPGEKTEVMISELSEKSGVSTNIIKTLVDKGIFEIYEKETGRLPFEMRALKKPKILNSYQQEALISIEKQFAEKQVVLLHGVTSSGKTEIYIHLIQRVLAEGKQVLYLVPEIALTTQLTTRLQQVFGNKLGVYHSGYSDNERVEVWNKLLKNKDYEVIIGVRSSVFLPFRQLGLVIVDEEHETSFKQQDPAPRYHARNAAIVLASMHNAKTLLGTATPSIESYFNAKTGKYGLVELHQRHEVLQMPEFVLVDMKEAYRKKQNEGHFSDTLIEKTAEVLRRKEQVILFQNRRGYAPMLECKACGYVPKCKNCDVSLTVHAAFNNLNCHYCGYTEPMPLVCPNCKTPGLNTKGFGTEKIEDEIKILFPEARVQRMDFDTTRNRKSYQKIISDFEDHKTDILIGTQMVTKGLDFQKVSLVGILNADNMLHFPDFRANERAFQLITQVSGRAGRKLRGGMVVIQTSSPQHPVILQVVQHNYELMFQTQCAERQAFCYPPFYRMIEITLKHKESQVVSRAACEMHQRMVDVFGNRVLGPVVPAISRIQTYYLRQLVLKIETEASHTKAKEILLSVSQQILSQQDYKSIKISIDVDPN